MFIEQLVATFNRLEIKYCIVGGYAVNLHGIPRMTYDIDIAIKMDAESIQNFQTAVKELNLSQMQPVDLSSLASEQKREELYRDKNLIAITFTDPANPVHEVDLLIYSDPPSDQLVEAADQLTLGKEKVYVANTDHLIRMKSASGRKQDLDDVRHLKQLQSDEETNR